VTPPPESEIRTGDSDSCVRHLKDQVAQLESALLAHQALLVECQQRQAFFEHAAEERLRVIEHGDQLLRSRAETISALQEETRQLRLQVDRVVQELAVSVARHREERNRVQRAYSEAGRGMAELAARERALVREILELRSEGLLHSIIRRFRSILS
jgi:chromosome segregation ATPase